MRAARLLMFALVAAQIVSCGTSTDLGQGSFGLRVCPAGPTLEGIDVSKWDVNGAGPIDWNQVAASTNPHLNFAIARVSDGLTYPDATFARNYSEIKRVGMVRGAYQFFRPLQDPIAQANLVLQAIGTLAPGDLPPALDIEDTPGDALPTPATFAAQINLWVGHVRAATGRAPLIYTRASFWDPYVAGGAPAQSPLWVAHYYTSYPPPASFCPNLPAVWSDFAFWQYWSQGSFPGITSAVDQNRFNGTRVQLMALTGPAAGPDAGVLPDDAGSATDVDGGDAPLDAGAVEIDATVSLADAGAEPTDASAAGEDAAAPPPGLDASEPLIDSGMPEPGPDAGGTAADSGASAAADAAASGVDASAHAVADAAPSPGRDAGEPPDAMATASCGCASSSQNGAPAAVPLLLGLLLVRRRAR